jgi:hypothetical protein
MATHSTVSSLPYGHRQEDISNQFTGYLFATANQYCKKNPDIQTWIIMGNITRHGRYITDNSMTIFSWHNYALINFVHT